MNSRVYSICILVALLAGLGLTGHLVRLQQRADDSAVTKAQMESYPKQVAWLLAEVRKARAERDQVRTALRTAQAVIAEHADRERGRRWLARADGTCFLEDR